MKFKITLFSTFLFYLVLGSAQAQVAKQNKEDAILSGQSWTVYDIKSRRPYAEIGEVFNFRIDKSFYYDQNNYAKRGGTWMLRNKTLVLVYDSFTEERRKIPIEHKLKKLKKGQLVFKYRNRNNKMETVYLN
jgi:hypothetical protein